MCNNSINLIQEVNMKVKLKSVLKTTDLEFDTFEDNQIIVHSGNSLCIRQIGKSECEFVSLSKEVDYLYCFKPAPNKKSVFTAERLGQRIQIASYALKGERKFIDLTENNSFFIKDNLESVELLVDQFDSSIVYGAVHGKNQASCVFLVDFQKMKILSLGFLSNFEDIKVSTHENMELSICGCSTANYIKTLRYVNGQWQIQEKFYKKIQKGIIIKHQLLSAGRVILATKNEVFVYDDLQPLQTLTINLSAAESIVNILKIPRGLLVFISGNKIKIFIEDSDQITLSLAGEMKIDLAENSNIYKVILSANNQEVIAKSTKNELFVWKCEELNNIASLTPKNYQLVKIQMVSTPQISKNLSISTQKKYCMLAGDNSITLWHIQQNRSLLSTNFFAGQNQKTIYACAISPDGNSFLAAFQDRVKVYKILLTKFRFGAQFTIKRCKRIVFSHSGQLVACLYGKGLNSSIAILNTLRLSEVGVLKTQAEPFQIIWNQLDDDLVVLTENNVIQCYKVNDCSKKNQCKINSPINFIRYDYLTKKLLVSTNNSIEIISNGEIIQSLPVSIPNFNYVYPLHGYYLAACKDGMLYWSNSLKFQYVNELPLFCKQSYSLLCRNGYLLAFTSYQNVLAVQYERLDFKSKKTGINEEIVLIQRDQIHALFEKVKILENNFDILTVSTQVKLEEERKMYEDLLAAKTKNFEQEISFCNKKFADSTMEKIKQQKETEKVFDRLETGQVRSVNDLEKMYDTRLKIQKQKYMTLQQSKLQQKMKYDKVILELQARYHRDVETIRSEYLNKMKDEYKKINDVKKIGLEYQKKMQMKLIDVQQQNQVTLFDMQKAKDDVILHLNEKIIRLEEELDKSMINIGNMKEQLDQSLVKVDKQKGELNKVNVKLQESLNRIQLLQTEVSKKNSMLQERDEYIQQQSHQIGGLEKAKYVLSFRTTEIRKELQPKESLIDKLKSELFKLDQEFKAEQKKSYEFGRKIEKYEKINQILKKQNGQLKVSFRNKERLHDQLCYELFIIVTTIDQKLWSSHIIKLYQNYIKQDKFKSRQQSKKKDDTVEEINRHLIHVEQSLMQVSSGNDKILKGKQKDVIRKLKENSELVFDLNVMRKKQNEYLTELKEKANEISRLKRELNEYAKPSTRANTANTGLTRRVIASRDLFSNDRSLLDIGQIGQEIRKESQARQKQKERSRIASAHKTLMWREDKRQKSGKLFDLARELENARGTIKRQDRMIEELNQRLLGGIEELGQNSN